jgi:hypothetical protein
MGSELAGVIACLQQIEIACVELEKHEDLRWVHEIPDLRMQIKLFFKSVSLDKAIEIQSKIIELGSGYRVDESDDTVLTASVKVDGFFTTLAALNKELAEVIEDLNLD